MKHRSVISLLILFVLVGCKVSPSRTPPPTSSLPPTPTASIASREEATSTPGPTRIVTTVPPTPSPPPTYPFGTVEQLPDPNTPVPLPPVAVEQAKSLIVSFEIEGGKVQVEAINMTYGLARSYIADPDQLRIKLKGSSGQILGEIRTWDPRVAFIYSMQDDQVGGEWNKQGNYLLAWADGSIRIWDVSGDQPITSFRQGGVVRGASWRADSSQILSWSDSSVLVWDASIGELLLDLAHDAQVKGAAWNANGSQILSWTANTALIWDASNGQLIHTLPHEYEVIGAAWDNTGNRILSVSGNTVKVWQAASGNLMLSLLHGNTVNGAAWNAVGSRIMSWDASQVNVWTLLGGGRLPASFPQEEVIEGAAWIGNSSTRILLWGGNTVRAWDAQRRNEYFVQAHDEEVNGAASNLDGWGILTWSGNLVNVWNVIDGSFFTLPHTREVKGAAWNQSEDKILSWDIGSVHVWDAANGELLFTLIADDGVDTVFVEKYVLNEKASGDLIIPFIPGLTSIELADAWENLYARIDLSATIQAFCGSQSGDADCTAWLDEMHLRP